MTDPLDDFFDRLANSRRGTLLLDYDGTLAPFHLNRNEAVPYPGVREVLRSIQAGGNTRMVVISGRASADLIPLLALEPPPEIWGSHGWERLAANGRREQFPIPSAALDGLSQGKRAAHDRLPDDRVEQKIGCVAIHWRGLNSDEQRRIESTIRSAWEPIVQQQGLEIHPFNGGLELRVPGRHKGMAVQSILDETPAGTPVAYLGDDLTDEDAFRALHEHGLGVLVRDEPRSTAAHIRLTPPDQMLDFLHRWENAVSSVA